MELKIRRGVIILLDRDDEVQGWIDDGKFMAGQYSDLIGLEDGQQSTIEEAVAAGKDTVVVDTEELDDEDDI